MKFLVNGYESTLNSVVVDAENEKEAIEKAWDGDVIEGTQDMEPGENIWKKRWSAQKITIKGGRYY